MSFELIKKVNDEQKKYAVVDVKSGDTVKVSQKIKEGNKERVQVFEGVVIRVDRKNSSTARITVRKITSGVGVEKSFLLHSPLVEKVEVVRRAKVRRNYLSFLRNRSGKSARLKAVDFDRNKVNTLPEAPKKEENVPAAAVPTLTLEQLRAGCAEMSRLGKGAELRNLIREVYKIQKLDDLDPKNYESFANNLRELGVRI